MLHGGRNGAPSPTTLLHKAGDQVQLSVRALLEISAERSAGETMESSSSMKR